MKPEAPYLCVPLRGARGGASLINERHWPLADGAHWYQTVNGYAFSPKLGFLHRRMTAAEPGPNGEHVNHRNFDRLDNRLRNLQCLPAYNYLNNKHARKRDTKWPYKGVRQQAGSLRWQARITVDRKSIHLGIYDTAEEAARAYDTKAKEAFGFLAVLNFPEEE